MAQFYSGVDISAVTAMGRSGDNFIMASWGWITRESFARCRSKVSWFDKLAGKTLTVVDQEIIESSLICDEVLSLAEATGARDVAIDPAMSGLLVQSLQNAGASVTVHYARQGMSSVAPAIAFLQSLMMRQTIRVADDGLLRMSVENTTIVSSSIGMRIAKLGGEKNNYGHNPRKIDPLSAALNCCQWFVAVGDSTSPLGDGDGAQDFVSAWTEPAMAANVKFRQTTGDGDIMSIDVPSRMITSPLGDPPCSWQDQL